ncbi:response regulator [Thalassospira sp. HJ]|uniref:response regulator n=1 Tax=Thalassospira sp. HJ TaxID=1616823 RepID=UPI0005CF68AE|nr:response regulator [Thalassospira sp. HJ]KJE34643.1 response regulator [Thalassospira sp. HJ]
MSVILFVDDDKNILDGLRRRFRSVRAGWELLFAHDAESALAKADEIEPDVVVSDMRMPGTDGAALLTIMQERHPHTARIILSGFAEEEAILRTVGPAHQYLAKPCDDQMLIETIENALDLRNLLTNPELRALVGGIDALASPPTTYTNLVKALENPLVSNDQLTAIVASDIALTAEILKLTNSAYFAVSMKITSISQAIRMIGIDTLKALALFIGLFRSFDGPKPAVARMMQLCQRSQQLGVVATLIAEQEKLPKEVINVMAAVGMLSHTGSLILYAYRANEMAEVVKRVETEDIPIYVAERDQFGAAHPEIGAYLLGLWGFPSAMVQTVAYHHRPQDAPHSEMNALSAIYVAQHLAREVAIEERTGTTPESRIDLKYLDRLGKRDRLPVWRETARLVEQKYREMEK